MYSFAVVGIRLIATYFFVTSLSQSLLLIPLLSQGSEGGEFFAVNTFVLFYAIFNLIIGIALWLISKWLGKIMVPKNKQEISILENSDWVAIGTFLIGLYWLTIYLPKAFTQTYYALNVMPEDLRAYPGVKTSINFEFIYDQWAVVFFALLIMLSAGKLSKIFDWLRKTGT